MISKQCITGMNNHNLCETIHRIGQQVEGEPGFWHFIFEGTRLVCVTSEEHDRMRVMTPIEPLDEIPKDALTRCMEANFDRVLDARYCISQNTLWAAYLHPLTGLTEEMFVSACHLVSDACQTFGTTYGSGDMLFDTGPR